MKKLKSNADALDRLSALPDSLILEILSFLEMRDVVQTSLLSKRWKYLWITIPCLQFYEFESDVVELRNFVNRTLMLWRGTHLRKFEICNGENNGLDYDANLWILFAKERKVEELVIHGLSPPQCLYECSLLRKLSITSSYLETYGNVQWDRLNSLKLDHCFFSELWMNHVFSSSPQLETFSYINDIQRNELSENLSIRSSSLKKLSLNTSYDESFVLTIWAPNLEVLKFSGRPCSGYLLTNIASLTKVYIGLNDYSSAAMVEEALSQILPVIQHVVTVTLSSDCFKMLGVMKDKYSVPPLSNVKLLKIEGGVIGISELLCLLEIFPKLEMLIIDWKYVGEQFKLNADLSDANILQSNLLLLRSVKICLFWYKNALIFEFIEFLLKHAAMIEKIVIQIRTGEVKNMISAAQKMLSLQRSYPSVELIIC